MKKILFPLLLIFLFTFTSCRNDSFKDLDTQNFEQEPKTPLTTGEIDIEIDNSFSNKGSFDWAEASNKLLWSATLEGNNILSIGYSDTSFSETRTKATTQLKDEIIKIISLNEKKSTKDIVIYEDETLNYIDVQVFNYKTIAILRERKDIRYIEPSGYVLSKDSQDKSASGCSTSSENISSADYGNLSSGAKVPWNFYDHNIDKAWSQSTGRGIGVGVIDTGLSDYQQNMGSKFDDFYSNRYVQKYGTYIDSNWWWSNNYDGPHDQCGHGTSACSAVAAPNNSNGSPVGVAYDCNLVSYRGTSDVVLNDYHERKGVSKALVALGKRSDIKIISMSLGYVWSIGNIKDAVRYAHSKGKMIFAAGGTSTNFTTWYGVIFPADMAETIAVTGVEEQSSYDACDVCHDGSEIDFTFIMERGNNNHQPVTGYYNNGAKYFGGSSVATASMAGVAALVWSKYPSWSREQVYNRMKWAADFYPSQHSDYGYGNVDALKAVRGY